MPKPQPWPSITPGGGPISVRIDMRGLIERIELRPGAEGYEILLRGDLAGILALSVQSKKPAALSRDELLQVALVAGVGFEPTTFRL